MHSLSIIINILQEPYSTYPIYIKIALIGIIVSLAIVLLTYLEIIFRRLESTSKSLRINEAKNLVTEELTNNLMLEDESDKKSVNSVATKLKKLTRGDIIFNQIIIDELIFFHRNFSDNTGRLLSRLYNRLNLKELSLKKLKNRSWNVQAQGLREIQEMPALTLKNKELIQPLLFSENNDLRIEAQAAYLRMNREHPFDFLNYADEDLLDWHQIILLEVIYNTEDLKVPVFSKWLDSPNITVITFCIKLIVNYHQLDAIPKLISLLDHPKIKIREDAVAALGKLYAEQSETRLVEIFAEQVLSVKLLIIEALGLIASGKNIDFLRSQFLVDDDFSIIKTAGCALSNHPDFDKNTAFGDINQLSLERKTIINHCTDHLIRN
ncbi:MAG TPA: HEAT repeat domain-containing protein [Sphingobacteriaceae bacterium]|nr:HEAT repeat domain-containing protein [Sphingobacteriaceae bacterium]